MLKTDDVRIWLMLATHDAARDTHSASPLSMGQDDFIFASRQRLLKALQAVQLQTESSSGCDGLETGGMGGGILVGARGI